MLGRSPDVAVTILVPTLSKTKPVGRTIHDKIHKNSPDVGIMKELLVLSIIGSQSLSQLLRGVDSNNSAVNTNNIIDS